MFRIVVITVIMVLISACSAIPDKNQDPAKNNGATFRKDWKECREDYPEQGSGIHIRQWEGCMNLKGWK
jgi:hypothetical protein